MQINQYPAITSISDGDLFMIQSASDGAYKSISASDLQAYFGGNSSTGGTGGTGSSDSDNLFSSVVLLLSNNNTVLLDKSSLANSISNSGVLLNSTSKFGANSAYFSGGSNIVTIPSRVEFILGNSDFTIEAWVFPTTLDSNFRHIISKAGDLSNNSNRSYSLSISTNNIGWYYTTNGISDVTINFPCTLTANDWHHIAISRSNGILCGFLDGILLASVAHTDTYFNSSAGITIGSFGGYAAQGYPQLSFIGNIEKDGLRITKNCRYAASFALPTKAFPTI
ncbi:LamG domain-containing protein [Nostoc sp.]|uniref:LamG domain-containing protein n=1 Tax=Nostoc sp. TaxID=1180 RepID=UPI002FFA11F3